MEPLYNIIKDSFLDIGSKLNGSLVYCDAGSAQLIRMNVGVSQLFSIGATNVCDLAQPAPQDGFFAIMQGRPLDTICIFISQLLTESHKEILNSILAHPSVETVHIFSGLSEHAHACQASTILGVEAYQEYASLLKQDVRDGAAAAAAAQQGSTAVDLAVNIQHFPLSMCALDSTSFVLPSTCSAAKLARSCGRAAGYMGSDHRPEEDDGEEGAQRGVSLLAHALASIASQLNAKPQPFCLGPVSQQLAAELSDLPIPPTPSARPTGPPTPMAVILVDRSLDLVTPARHTDHLLDTLLGVLPRPDPPPPSPDQDEDELVDWRELDSRIDVGAAYPLAGPLQGGRPLGSGLQHPDDVRAVQWWEDLMNRKGKDAALYLRKWLKEALRAEKLPPPVRSKAGVAPPSEFAALAGALAAQPGTALRNRVILTLGYANSSAMASTAAQRWEAAGALERQVLLTVGEDSGAAAAALLDALANVRQPKALLQVEDVVAVLLQVYSLVGDGTGGPPFPAHIERELAAGITAALLEGGEETRALLPLAARTLLSQASDDAIKQAVVEQQVDALVAALRHAACARQQLQEFRHWATAGAPGLEGLGLQRTSSTPSGAPTPLLRTLMERIVMDEPLPELLPPTSVVRGLLSQGLGRLGLQTTKPKPNDFGVVLVFVVGGVSPLEVREVRQELSEQEFRRKPHVLVGGTCLLAPRDVVARAFGS